MSLQIMISKIKRYKLFLLFLSSFTLLSCGGKGITVVEGGISGTGIALGRITKFGSIYVNGVRFNVDSATFTRDGKPSQGQSEFSIGEYITIKGSFDKNGTGGKAVEVSFKDILEGAVTEVSSDDKTIEVLGQSVKTDKLSTLLGFSSLNELVAGNIVEVSGFKDAKGLINATSIKLKQSNFIAGISENELKGVITDVNAANKTIMIGNILIDYNSSILEGFNGENIKEGQLVEVKSNSEIIGNTLLATKIELEDKNQNVTTNINLEVEGIVTRFVSLLDFDVNGISVLTNSTTKYKKGNSADIELNSVLEVKGKVNSLGILVADKIEFENNNSKSSDVENNDSDKGDGDSSGDNSENNNSDGDSENNGSDDDSEDNNSNGNSENNGSDDDSENNNSDGNSENNASGDDSENSNNNSDVGNDSNSSGDEVENNNSNTESGNNGSDDDTENNSSNDNNENNSSNDNNENNNSDGDSETGDSEDDNEDKDSNNE